MSRTLAEWTRLFRKLGIQEPEKWASCEVNEGLGNLAAFAFLRQAWNEIPSSGDAVWLGNWMRAAKSDNGANDLTGACDRLIAVGASPGDIVTLIRGALGEFLYQLCYKLDDNSIEDEELSEATRWGLWEEDDDDEPIRRIGCIHELVSAADPESHEG